MRTILATLFTILLLLPPLRAGERRDSVIVSLVTCWPGKEVYELCGHEAIRVRGEGIDSVWNYGVFDFNEPNFVGRFVSGQTDYMLASYPFPLFMAEYVQGNRRVVEQDLNLSQEEAWRLLGMLREEALPRNRTYRYNYVKDNCATRIVDRVDQAADRRVIYPDTVKYGTFRREMRSYHKDYPWYQFGIDLALGSGLDVGIPGRAEMFVPIEMMEKVDGAHFDDGAPLVARTRILFEGGENASLPPTPWYVTPLFIFSLLSLLMILIAIVQLRRKRIVRWIYSVWFGILGFVGCLTAFLVFVSTHEATSPNILLVLLNPLQLIVAVGVWMGWRGRWMTLPMVWWNVVAVGLLLLAWPMQRQTADPAMFPIMAATVALAASYAIIISTGSYKNSAVLRHNKRINEQVSNSTRRSGNTRRNGSGRSSQAKARGGNRR